ncbi:CD276 antigen-like [Poecilia formosa]|uniref:CD276 antigen-like n=1 Tax=Poecilia formosa TaxID=48698 RepID=UPI0007BA9EA6|nr:PREDICTED: CD276 antigen-like [Poecilia formosa]
MESSCEQSSAPVSSVRIHQDGNRITCSSEGIYPEPELTWSTEPPSNTTLQSRTTVHQTEEKLYDISSSLTVPDGPDRIYSCSIRTKRIWWGATLTRADHSTELSPGFLIAESRTKVSCFLNESCILPCRFRNRVTDMTWEREIPKSQIVTYNQSGSRYSESFRSRASLSEDQISRGNGKLLLRGVKVDDEGTYWCKVFTTGIYYRHSVDLTVEAPLSPVRIHQDGNRITCSSEGIYPQPELTWSIYPPSNMTLQNRTTVHQTEEKLYDISSSLTVPDEDPGLIYRCTVSTMTSFWSAFLNPPGQQMYRKLYSESFRSRASLFEDQISRGNFSLLLRGVKVDDDGTYWCIGKINGIYYRQIVKLIVEGAEVTICCTSLHISTSSLVWRFNHHQIILTKTDRNIYSVSEEWRKHVRNVSASGSLTLQDLTSDQEGVYSCELSDDKKTIITHLYLRTGENLVVSELIRWTVVCVVIAAAAAVFLMFYKKTMEESEALQL